MSEHPTRPVRAWRAGLLVAVAAALIMPSGVLAKPGKDHGKGEGKKDNEPAVCERDAKGPQSPGLEKNGKTPPGQAKKTEDARPCNKDEDKPAEQPQPQPAAPAPAEGSASSQSPQVVVLPPCTSKRFFRITLGKRKNIKRARVLLNGRPIAITRGKRNVTARIDLRHRVKGTYVVRTVVVTKRLRIRTGTRRYRVCGG
ncbi:MAG TPA: hypothetical protein VF549_02375 [Solirubrobacteraceae bacterium]|jgi:hypothetical protein